MATPGSMRKSPPKTGKSDCQLPPVCVQSASSGRQSLRRYTSGVNTGEELRKRLATDILVGDGAYGTSLAAAGFDKRPYDLANLEAPELVAELHRRYFVAGTTVLETNTYSANPLRLGELASESAPINRLGAQIAKEVAKEFPGTFVVGAIGPCGKPVEPIGNIMEKEAMAAFNNQACALIDGGVDGFLLETFTDTHELELAISAIRELSDLPIIASRSFIEDGESLAEGLPTRVAEALSRLGVDAIGANCVVGPQRMLDIIRMMREGTDLPLLGYPTPGLPQISKGQIIYDKSPEYFAKATARLIEAGATLLGGCCGSTPDHIRVLAHEVQSFKRRPVSVKPRPTASASEEKVLPETEKSELAAKLEQGRFIRAVEMDVPRGLNMEKLVKGARSLKIVGADIINISDGARARLRMNPTAVSSIIQNRVGIEVTMHFACRDRNLLAIQADLLGAHALGIRNILAVTGDPTNIGDYPSATSVFDVDSIGLIRTLARFNSGYDFAGNSLGLKCGFTIAAALNPQAPDEGVELDRLKRKVDAGVHVIYTQPLFDERSLEKSAEWCAKVGVPCFLGLLPIRNQRHSDFMHHEVPGITIPEGLRKRIAEAASDADALEIGISETEGLAAKVRRISAGIYVMPPFGSAAVAARVLAATGGK